MKRGLLASCFFLSCSVAWATAPSITSISGSTVAPRANLVWQGTNFGVKAPANPVFHADYRDSIAPSTVSQIQTYDEQQNMSQTSSCHGLLNAAGCIIGTWAGQSPLAFDMRIDRSFWEVIYHYQIRYYTSTNSDNMKAWRMYPASGLNNFVFAYNGLISSPPGGGISLNEIEPSVNGVIGGYQGDYPTANQWMQERFIWKYSGGHGKNNDGTTGPGGTGIWDYRRNGLNEVHRENVDNGTDNLQQFYFIENFTDGSHSLGNGESVEHASVYIDTQPQACFISTSATWVGAIDARPQPMTFRSSTAAVTYTDLTGIDTSKTLYGYVTNTATGDVNTTGFAITLIAANTNLHLTVGTITQTSVAISWDNVSPNQLAVFSANSDFSSPISSGNMTTPQTYSNLTCNTQYYFEVKVSTESDSGYTSTNATTLACSAVSPFKGGINGNGKWSGNGKFQ